MGADVAPALFVMNPVEPYNTTSEFDRYAWSRKLTKLELVNNYFGRQFNSPNDVAVNPRNNDLYWTDTLYGYLQDFRPPPALPQQVYRITPETGAVSVVADGFGHPNGVLIMVQALACD
jgi:gluconolactonase